MQTVEPTIVIITHHANHLLVTALRSIEQQNVPLSTVVLHSHERQIDWPTWTQSHHLSDNFTYHWLGGNMGYAHAVNWAFSNCSGPLFILNDDVQLDSNCIESLIAAHQHSPTAILQPIIYLSEHPEIIENAGHHVHIDGMNSAVARGQNTPVQRTNRLCFSGAAVWIPEVVYRHPRLTSMDPDLSPFGEDVDYSLRCIRYGFQIQTVPEATLSHHWGGSFARYSAQKVTWVESHRIQAKIKNLPWWMILCSPISSSIRYLQSHNDARVPKEERLSAILATVQGIRTGYQHLPTALKKRRAEEFTVSDWDFTIQWWQQR
jgi:GT2 family glycosyltransferase